jgi:type II secretory ATPase GspE/PulE/Tfp pilus assembly ATPase PilB-like protein
LCQECKEEYHIDEKEIETLGKTFDMKGLMKFLLNQDTLKEKVSIKKGWEGIAFYRPKGCDQCGNEGYRGRMGIYEVLEMDAEIKKLVTQSATTEALNEQAEKSGMATMVQDGFMKAISGITSLEEILRVTKE